MKTMPSFSESLEKTLHNALKAASERHHEYATLEHLLYALIDDDHAAEVMRACGVALDDLQSAVVHYLDTELDSLKVEGHSDPSPTSRSEENTAELQSLMRISSAVFCLKKKKKNKTN